MPFDSVNFLPSPVKPEVTEPWRKVLMDAADYIEAHGWCQRAYNRSDGHVCAVGAMLSGRGSSESLERFREFVGSSISFWNDTPGRTAAEVCAALRACAAS